MITGVAALLLNTFSITMLSAVVVMLVISVAFTTGIWQRWNFSAEDRRRGLWFLVLSPWLIGLIATVIVLSMSWLENQQAFTNRLVHWHHLLTFTFVSWHGYLLLTIFALALMMILRVLKRVLALQVTTRTLDSLAIAGSDDVHILDSDSYAAFTTGLTSPRCFMTRALKERLNEREYEVIRLHEYSHVQQNDPAQKAWFQIFAGFFPELVARFLNVQLATAIEQIADSNVAHVIQDRAFIARALLKVKRLTDSAFPATGDGELLCHFGLNSTELRIRYLLSDEERSPLPFALVFTGIVILAIGCAMGMDTVHHAIESSLLHFQQD